MERTIHLTEAVHSRLRREASRRDLPKLPTFDSGGFRVNIADREELYDFLDRQAG